MQIELNKDLLTKNLLLIQSIVEKKKTLPILANVLIKAETDLVYLLATDLEISIEIKLEAKIIKNGITTLPAKKLYEIIREMPEQIINIETQQNDWICIKSGKSEFNLAGISPNEFPNIKTESDNIVYTYEPKKLKNIIDKTINCISSDEKKFNLNGLYIHTEEKMIRYVATDGHRLICIKDDFTIDKDSLNEGIIIPKKGILEIKKICENIESELIFHIVNGKAIFNIENITLSIRLIDATFPNYRRVIPEKSEKKANINTKQLFDSIKRVSIVSDEKNRTVDLSLSLNNLEIFSKNEYGNALEKIDITYNQEEINSKFKANYLLDILSSIDCEHINLFLSSDGKPSLIIPEKNNNYCAVLMPISA